LETLKQLQRLKYDVDYRGSSKLKIHQWKPFSSALCESYRLPILNGKQLHLYGVLFSALSLSLCGQLMKRALW